MHSAHLLAKAGTLKLLAQVDHIDLACEANILRPRCTTEQKGDSYMGPCSLACHRLQAKMRQKGTCETQRTLFHL